MATDAGTQDVVTWTGGSTGAATGGLVGWEAAAWLLSRVADGAGEALFVIDADERYWRVRRTAGLTASMFEAALRGPASTQEVAAALVRWASAAGLAARLHADPGAPVRVSLARLSD